jgi:hypothetical protein
MLIAGALIILEPHAAQAADLFVIGGRGSGDHVWRGATSVSLLGHRNKATDVAFIETSQTKGTGHGLQENPCAYRPHWRRTRRRSGARYSGRFERRLLPCAIARNLSPKETITQRYEGVALGQFP